MRARGDWAVDRRRPSHLGGELRHWEKVEQRVFSSEKKRLRQKRGKGEAFTLTTTSVTGAPGTRTERNESLGGCWVMQGKGLLLWLMQEGGSVDRERGLSATSGNGGIPCHSTSVEERGNEGLMWRDFGGEEGGGYSEARGKSFIRTLQKRRWNARRNRTIGPLWRLGEIFGGGGIDLGGTPKNPARRHRKKNNFIKMGNHFLRGSRGELLEEGRAGF